MTVIDTVGSYSRRIPTIRSSDWFIRLPLAAIVIEQGFFKLSGFAAQAEGYGLPLIVFALATFADLAGGLAILLGGLMRDRWETDLLTRLGGLAIMCVTAGVIVMIYFGPFSGWQFQGMILAAAAFFALRGNGDTESRRVL
ncbi:hypothetical protein E2L08_12680 [Palleronia sediminis]|uniref:Uncharacterized protein n=1 Tax=Palleronia sediminis TaxID=2547833 RepID=A0A4R6A4Q3_9RHOB|nr:hypothetical protein [Palleronia sediminis]TDL77644.1 hypothetical protein E2L08_12680 [Palleronia sediminis]